jgi:predicted nuclease of predicted toxin-antitoxin system
LKLLIDMTLSPQWVAFLRDAGFETLHWSSFGDPTAPDVEIMAFAKTHSWIVVTLDLDFGAILAATQGDKPSVVQLRAGDHSPETIGRQVIAAFHQINEELDAGALLTVDTRRTRLRVLPLRSGS